MRIYWIKAQAPQRVLALVKLLGISAELVHMDLLAGELATPAYTGLNPNLKAPTLVDGELVLWESSAIMAHLCISRGSDMWPSANAAEQVEVLRWLSWGDTHWSPAVAPFYFEHVVKATFAIGEPDRAITAQVRPALLRYAEVLDGHLARHDFVACDRLTIADFQLASMASYWKQAEMPLQPYSEVIRWLDRLDEIPAWADPWPEPQSSSQPA